MSNIKENGVKIFSCNHENYNKRKFEKYLEKELSIFEEFKREEENKFKRCFININKNGFCEYESTTINYLPIPVGVLSDTEGGNPNNDYGSTDINLPVETAVKLLEQYLETL